MSICTKSAVYEAMESSVIQIEATYVRGFSGLQMIGNTTEVCRNGLERAKAALETQDIKIPSRKIMLSLLPAEIKKDGSQFDLPFAVCLGALITNEPLRVPINRWLFVSELSLDGSLRPVRGVISFALAAISQGLDGIVVSQENLEELSVLKHSMEKTSNQPIQILGFKNIQQVFSWLGFPKQEEGNPETGIESSSHTSSPCEKLLVPTGPNYNDMVLSPELEELATVCAAGLHSMMLYGPPGTGKSMFSERLCSIMPTINGKDQIEALKIHSIHSPTLPRGLLAGRPPFRNPHHQATAAAIMGVPDNPGEMALAHGGVLFLDELPEFRRDIVESLREPLETGQVRVSRAQKKIYWKSRVTLIAACNNCPCGWFASRKRRCTCPMNKILAYRRKLSGPILDRIDIHMNMPETMVDNSPFIASLMDMEKRQKQTQTLRNQVKKARKFAHERNTFLKATYNRDLKPEALMKACGQEKKQVLKMLKTLNEALSSHRSVFRTLRVARTLADLRQSPGICERDLNKALKWTQEVAAKQRGDQAIGLS